MPASNPITADTIRAQVAELLDQPAAKSVITTNCWTEAWTRFA